MMRFGPFVVVLILVFVPLAWLRAEDEAPVIVLAGGDPGAVNRVFRSPDAPPGTLFFERRLEAPPAPRFPRRPKICPAQGSPGEPAPGTAAPGTAAPGTAAPGTARDLCDVGYEISRMDPCTSAEDCPAHELWSRELGAPGLQPARPDRVRRTPSPAGAATPAAPGDHR